MGLAQVFPAGALAGVVIEAVLKELETHRAFLDDLGPRLGPDRHVVVAPGVGLALELGSCRAFRQLHASDFPNSESRLLTKTALARAEVEGLIRV